MTTRVKKWLIPLIAVGLLLLIIAWMAGAFRQKIEPGIQELESSTGLEAYTAQDVEVLVTEPVPANVGARQATTISSRTLARITQITVRAGDSVTKGQLLIELESSDLLSRLEQTREQVRATQARLTEARQGLQRAEELNRQDLIADALLDEARSRNDSLTAELASAQQSVKEAEIALSYTVIEAPIDGRVVERFAEPGDTASPGDKLLTLYNPLSLRIEAAVREGLALPLVLGQQLMVEIPTLNQALPAQVEELVPAADPGARSFMVKARIDYDGRLLPGMYARLLVPAATEQLVLIPNRYVREYGQLDVIWVRTENRVDRRFVRIGREMQPGMVEVISGLDAGETVVLPMKD